MRAHDRPYAPDKLARVAVSSSSFVDMLRRLGQPLGSEPLRYLRARLDHYGIDTSHFADESLPERPRRRYTEEVLRDAAERSTSLREMIRYLEIPPYSSAYSHLAHRLKHFGIDTSHFAAHPSGSAAALPEEPLRAAVAESRSLAGVIRQLALTDTGATRRALKRAIADHGLSTRHFTGQGHNRGRASPRRQSADAVLRLLPPGSRRTNRDRLHRALQEKQVPYLCQECGLADRWQGRRLVLVIDHRNGDRLDNRLANLRYLCPSCHSQTATFARHRASPRGGARDYRAAE